MCFRAGPWPWVPEETGRQCQTCMGDMNVSAGAHEDSSSGCIHQCCLTSVVKPNELRTRTKSNMTIERPGLSQLQGYEGNHVCLQHQCASLGSPCRPNTSGTQRVESHGITEDTWPWSQQPCSAQNLPGCVTWFCFFVILPFI